MTDNHENNHRAERYGKTERKTITLTREGIEAIESWSAIHNLYFSVAIETLAMLGLERQTAETLPRLVSNLLERTINHHFNRFAKLLALTALSAEAANYKTDHLILQQIWLLAQEHPDDFARRMLISREPRAHPDAQVRRLRNQIRRDAHAAAERLLREPLENLNLRPTEEDGDA